VGIGPALARMRADVAQNLRSARFDRSEVAGSLGDLGTFLPLLVAMSVVNGLDFASSLLFAGVCSIATGLLFPIPLAVQPMKAIAAIAIAQGLSSHEITAAGGIVSLVVLSLGLLGAIDLVQRLIPNPVVRGMQFALGITLLLKALSLVWGDSLVVGGLAALFVALTINSRRIPVALVLFVAGTVFVAWTTPSVFDALQIGWTMPAFSPPAMDDVRRAFTTAALPQIPLTTLNSVVAVSALSITLFPDRPAAPRRVAVSVGFMNLIGMWWGAMPLCHGAGGLAGQYRFGARTNGSILMLGVAKVALAIVGGASLLPLCRAFPMGILGVMLAVSGIELASAAVRGLAWRRAAPALRMAWGTVLPWAVTVVLCLALQQLMLGVAAGAVTALIARRMGGAVSVPRSPSPAPTPAPSTVEHPASCDR